MNLHPTSDGNTRFGGLLYVSEMGCCATQMTNKLVFTQHIQNDLV